MNLVKYITEHGHQALDMGDGTLVVTSEYTMRDDLDGSTMETIPSTYEAVRNWLGY